MKRVLMFRAVEQKLIKDPSCSFEGIVSGTRGYLRARFSFNKAWNGYAKVAVFRKLLEEHPVVLQGDSCDIPAEVLDWDNFYVRVVGRKKDGSQLTTNEIEVRQSRGGAVV